MNAAALALALALAAAAPAHPAAPAPGPIPPIHVAEMGNIVIGGAPLALRGLPPRPRIRAPSLPPAQVDPNGDFNPGATYVHFVRLAAPRHPVPILLLPGGGLSGAVYETTPDGRPGWESFFLRAGYSVFTADLQQTGRSPFARYPEITPDEPAFRDRAFLWEVFRIGPPGSYGRGRRPFAGTQFPVAAFDDFARLAAPRFRLSPEAEAYDAIVRRICPCIIIAHSASAGPALAAAYRRPALVRAIVAVEPASVPVPPEGPAPPALILWGDYWHPDQTQADWQAEHEESRLFAAAGSPVPRAAFVDLPTIGIRGNSHLPMADRNSDCVARVILRWIGESAFSRAARPRPPRPGGACAR